MRLIRMLILLVPSLLVKIFIGFRNFTFHLYEILRLYWMCHVIMNFYLFCCDKLIDFIYLSLLCTHDGLVGPDCTIFGSRCDS